MISPGEMESTAWKPSCFITEEGYATDSNILTDTLKNVVASTTDFILDMMKGGKDVAF